MSEPVNLLDLVKVHESEGTKAQIDSEGFSGHEILIGAIKERDTPDNRDIWTPVYADKLDKFHNEMDGPKVHGNDVDMIEAEISRLYPAPPPGTFRVVFDSWKWFGTERVKSYYGGYQDRRGLVEKRGWGVFTGDIGVAVPLDLAELRQLSEQNGSLLVEYVCLQNIMDKELDEQRKRKELAGESSSIRHIRANSSNMRPFYEREDFTFNEEVNDYVRVRYNPTVRAQKRALSKFKEDREYRDMLCSGQFDPEDDKHKSLLRGLYQCIAPGNWTQLRSRNREHRWTREQHRYIDIFSGNSTYDASVEKIITAVELIAKVFGRSFKLYRSNEWHRALVDIAPYIAGWNVKYGQYKDPKKAYLRIRRETPDLPLIVAWQEANQYDDEVRFLKMLERECRACKVPIPKLPPEPKDPRKNRKKKQKQGHKFKLKSETKCKTRSKR